MDAEFEDIEVDPAAFPPMSREDRAELLLGYFAALVEGMAAGEVLALRARILGAFAARPERETLVGVLDAKVASRTNQLNAGKVRLLPEFEASRWPR